jgi:hypothetical protein
MKKLLIVILLILGLVGPAFAGPLQDNTLVYANTIVGTTEATGNNDGKVIEEILGYIGLPKGQPYCMATVVFAYHKGAVSIGAKDQLPKLGRVSGVWKYAQANPFKYKIITPNQIILKRETLQPGDIAIFSRSGGTVSNFNGHTGIICIYLDKHNQFYTIEGNTGPEVGTKAKDEGEGDGIWVRKRNLTKKNGNLGLKGFVRIKLTSGSPLP